MSGTMIQPTDRKCTWCHGPISQSRPLFLVAMSSGAVLGPFHAGCAERLKIQAMKMLPEESALGGERFGTWPLRREETVPE